MFMISVSIIVCVNEEQKMKAIALEWEETERGWGTRPDGISIHTTSEEADRYVQAYNDCLHKECPAEYDRPTTGKKIKVEVCDELAKRITGDKQSCRLYRHNYTVEKTANNEVILTLK